MIRQWAAGATPQHSGREELLAPLPPHTFVVVVVVAAAGVAGVGASVAACVDLKTDRPNRQILRSSRGTGVLKINAQIPKRRR